MLGKLQRAHTTLHGHFPPAYLVGSNILRAHIYSLSLVYLHTNIILQVHKFGFKPRNIDPFNYNMKTGHYTQVRFLWANSSQKQSILGMDRISGSVSGIRRNPAIFQLSGFRPDIKKPDIRFPNIRPDIRQTGYLIEYLSSCKDIRCLAS